MHYDLIDGRARFPSLRGRHVFITGGGSGIGRSLVEHFADQGFVVSFVDLNDAASEAVIAGVVARGHAAPDYKRLDLREVEHSRRTSPISGQAAVPSPPWSTMPATTTATALIRSPATISTIASPSTCAIRCSPPRPPRRR